MHFLNDGLEMLSVTQLRTAGDGEELAVFPMLRILTVFSGARIEMFLGRGISEGTFSPIDDCVFFRSNFQCGLTDVLRNLRR